MKYEKKIYLSIFWIVAGAVLVILSISGIATDNIWLGLGCGWIACGIMQIARYIRYIKDDEYRKDFDVKMNDERSRFISSKAWACAGYGFVIIAGFASVALFIAGKNTAARAASVSVFLIVFLYWLSYCLLKKKY